MAIKSIDALAGIDMPKQLVHPRVLQAAAARRSQPPSAPLDAASQGADANAERKAAQSKQLEVAAQNLAPQSSSLRFHVDQDTGKTVAELLDPEGQVLRQMPTEEALEVAKAIGKYQGMFVDLKV